MDEQEPGASGSSGGTNTNTSVHALTDKYLLLGVSANCSRDELRKAYYRKQRQFHTDKGGDLAICQQLNEAYRTLSDETERSKYDSQRAEDGHGFNFPTSVNRSVTGGHRLSDDFKKMFAEFMVEGSKLQLQDGFYELYTKVMEKCKPIPLQNQSQKSTVPVPVQCNICLTSFRDEEEHALVSVGPYLDMFALEEGAEPDLFTFLSQSLGSNVFLENPIILQLEDGSIFSAEAWLKFQPLVRIIRATYIETLKLGDFNSTIRKTKEISKEAAKWIIWAHGNNKRPFGDILQELLKLTEKNQGKMDANVLEAILGMAAYLEATAENIASWGELAGDMLDLGFPSTAMVFAKLEQVCECDREDVWLQIGMRLLDEFEDIERAFACFIFGSCDLEQVAETMTRGGLHRLAIALLLKVKRYGKLKELALQFRGQNDGANVNTSNLYLSAFLRACLSRSGESEACARDIHDAIDCLQQHLSEPMFIVALKRLWLAFPDEFLESRTAHETMARRLTAAATGGCKTGLQFRQLVGAMHALESATGQQMDEHAHDLLNTVAHEAITAFLYSTDERANGTTGLADILRLGCSHAVANRIWNEKTNNGQLDLKPLPGPYAAALYLIKGCIGLGLGSGAGDFVRECALASHTAPVTGTQAAAALFQDPEKHTGILRRVNEQLAQFKRAIERRVFEQLSSQAFPDILTDTSPVAVCEFRDRLAGIDALKIVRLGEISLARYTNTGADADPESLAATGYSYLDLCMADVDSTTKIGALLMAASYFLRAMEASSSSQVIDGETCACAYAWHKLLHVVAYLVQQTAHKHSTPFMLSYVQRLLFSILLKANCAASDQIRATNEENRQRGRIALRFPTNSTGLEAHCLHQMEMADFYASLLQESLMLRLLVPVQTNRMYSALDSTYLNFIGVQHLKKFIGDKLRGRWRGQICESESEDLPAYIYEYYALEGIWNGWLENSDVDTNSTGFGFNEARARSMASLLAANGWSLDDVADLMQWPMLRRSSEGWHNTTDWSLQFSGQERQSETFSRFYGLEVNERTAEVKLLVAKPAGIIWKKLANSEYPPLFDGQDVHEIFLRNLHGASFTLDEPSSSSCGLPSVPMRSHPFQEAGFEPRAALCGSNYLATLLHADLLLKELTTGTEVSAQPPFAFKDVKSGLLSSLPAKLQKLLASPSERKLVQKLEPREIAHRFWIEVTDVKYNVPEMSGDVQRFEVGEVKVGVFTKRLTRDPNTGRLVDDSESEDNSSAELAFAKALTDNYVEIGHYFPVLLRIKELMKISVACAFVESYVDKSHKLEQENLAPSMREILTRLKSCVSEFPIHTSSKVEECLRDCLRANGVSASQCTGEALRTARTKIENELRSTERKVVDGVKKRLVEDLYLDESEVQPHVYSFLAGNGRAFGQLATIMENGLKRKYRRICEALHRTLGLPIAKNGSDRVRCEKCAKQDEGGGGGGTKCCNWVPATFASAKTTKEQQEVYLKTLREAKAKGSNESAPAPEIPEYLKNYRIYGGVRMCPNLNQGAVRTGVWERSVSASGAVGGGNGSSGGGGGGRGGKGASPPPPPPPSSSASHRNRNDYAGQQSHVYAIRAPGGGPSTLKIGISARGTNSAGLSIRAETQARSGPLQAKYGTEITTRVLRLYNTKAEARAYETNKILLERHFNPEAFPLEKSRPRETKEYKAIRDKYLASCERKFQKRTAWQRVGNPKSEE